VIDQFEEFLILHGEEERKTFAAFLSDLAKNPIDGLRILLVFRSDYRPLVFKLDLPLLVATKNWHELAPYDRGEATAFLQSGGRELSSQAIDALFRGLDRIEDAPGIYRPITLNMVGLVLERMGQTLEGDPGRLIQSYLTACLTRSESRDFAKPLLAHMITDAGTKEPRSEADLAQLTGFESWQVKAALADLARHGLVRPLEAATTVWEIAHDFLARLIGQTIGRLKPNVLQRARPLVAPVVLLGWIALVVLALPYWITMQERASEVALRHLGASFSEWKSGGIVIRFPNEFNDEKLNTARPHLERTNPSVLDLPYANVTDLEPLKGLTDLRSLDLSSATRITSLEPLKGLTNLASLDLSRATRVTSLEPLRGLTNLTSLNLSHAAGITSLEPLKGLTNLTSLNLSYAAGITSLEPLKALTNLRSLDLSRATRITSLEPLKGLTNLSSLDLSAATGIASLEPLKGLTNLTSLNLSYAAGITRLEPLKALTNLTSLNLSYAAGITSLEPLKELTNLTSLTLSYAAGITSLEPLKGLTNLTSLNLYGATGITSLEPLKALTNLRSLDLTGATGITTLEPLKGLTNLRSLDVSRTGVRSLEPLRGLANLNVLYLSGTTGITSLEPLKGRDISVRGASDELLATMQ
jgi:Leucine-rich repeat (LRR) protein